MANFMPAVRYRWRCRGAIYLSHEPFLFIATPFQVCYVITYVIGMGEISTVPFQYLLSADADFLLFIYFW